MASGTVIVYPRARRVVATLLTVGAVALGGVGCQPPPSSTLPTASVGAWSLPDPRLTPGAVQSTDVHDVCPRVNPAFERGRPGTSVKNRVYRTYGITEHPTGRYEVDHLIPLELGGANASDNLWPEPNDHPARHPLGNSKDELEDVLHRLVCAG